MKPSDMKKDISTSIRINSELKKKLEKIGVSVQNIVDKELDNLFSIELSSNEVDNSIIKDS